MPLAFPQHQRQQHHIPSQPQPEREQQSQDDQSNRLQKPAAAKSRSIFTPIDDSRSLLAQHHETATQMTCCTSKFCSLSCKKQATKAYHGIICSKDFSWLYIYIKCAREPTSST